MIRILVTGGAGFIGTNLVYRLLARPDVDLVVLDLLTYAGNLDNLAALRHQPHFHFVHGDLADRVLLDELLREHRPDVIFNLASESHVDRSIDSPRPFVHTNLVGTFELLDATRLYWSMLDREHRDRFRLLHVSTDEVFGSLGQEGAFSETTAYAPRSPYAATKAGADHLVRAFFHTYGMPTITTNCSNNFGPYQFPEKLVPLALLNALEGKTIPIYGDGKHVRDWLHVHDHCDALLMVSERGKPGQTYNIGARNERSTLQMVETICALLDEWEPAVRPYRDLIRFVMDRPGHDRRYAIDPSKMERELGWKPRISFEQGMRETVKWYLDNRVWCDRITQRVYGRERLGLGASA
ncbi:MAG TPA: dTDP-glucose 4,6-dehydratase [Polyangiaceae bacterium]|jgi:dTDP-glucose 4,6-dehydratase|nr:MAG: dTDP-glucose 4,6-dehydratase 2 [Deltaproteobacteria bacterium ADurb.Bin207]HNS98915.1 dTDP-glucose 4,6-dehydratase [Polyangiaceae bacterium]HNZ24879.1 dTDP-glucose 4,6-dehydratase [Polyangiaceae bacterium]HOD24589.1 dTDP-glucose 4,6-dehydratase [Polyangiaceae bacterium]HOE50222.1 dTDP-glucose 4,6-dehydratase [Polyangiaceae bacterium]